MLIGDLGEVCSAEDLASWAFRKMPIKNSLAAHDARAVEDMFQARLDGFTQSNAIADAAMTDAAQGHESPDAVLALGTTVAPPFDRNDPVKHPDECEHPRGLGRGIDKSVLAISEPRRCRDKAHLKFVATHACLVCGRQPCDAHHLRYAQPRALGRKVSDEFVVPLCRGHHREVHRCSNEIAWWNGYGIDAGEAARNFWTQTHAALVPTNGTSEDIAKPAAKQKVPPNADRRATQRAATRKTKPIPKPGAVTSFKPVLPGCRTILRAQRFRYRHQQLILDRTRRSW